MLQDCDCELRKSEPNTDVLYQLGHELCSHGKYEKALQAFETIVRQEPSDHESINAMGVARYKMGKFGEAILDFKKAILLWGDEPEYYLDLGDAFVATEQMHDAKAAYQKAIGLALPNEEASRRAQRALENR